VDADKLRAIAAKANADAIQASAALREALGKPSLNPASTPQLLAALRAAGLELDSTAEAALKEADDARIVPLVLAHREAIKRAQQAESLLAHVQADGRIHARFEPTGTATGRFSSKEPNLQNIGRGELREAFVPEPGHKFVVADYSQVELRAAAAIAGETKMIAAYRAGQDLHKLTASTVLGADSATIRKEQRQTAKAVSFGFLYGQSPNGLVRYAAASYGVHLEPEQALEIRKAFFRTYGHLRQWHGLSHQKAERGVTEVRTRLGRRRLIPETATDWERFTALVNTPVQGGCADGMKRAIVLVAERLPEGARILSTVHDELIVEDARRHAKAADAFDHQRVAARHQAVGAGDQRVRLDAPTFQPGGQVGRASGLKEAGADIGARQVDVAGGKQRLDVVVVPMTLSARRPAAP
jgi:DNA polymerase I-like protein with 3'-5' exonuclease and polymerase domains